MSNKDRSKLGFAKLDAEIKELIDKADDLKQKEMLIKYQENNWSTYLYTDEYDITNYSVQHYKHFILAEFKNIPEYFMHSPWSFEYLGSSYSIKKIVDSYYLYCVDIKGPFKNYQWYCTVLVETQNHLLFSPGGTHVFVVWKSHEIKEPTKPIEYVETEEKNC
jgi:hypothetical protein